MTARNAKRESSRGAPTRRLSVVYHPIDALRLDPRNPRVHSRKQIRQIARSIETFDFNVPIVVDGNLKVIAGHGRVLAAQELGWREVPTGGKLWARTIANQRVEAAIKCATLNQMTVLGMPDTVRVF